jgi:hypothetical protein
MTNDNCLAGIRCPKCGFEDGFFIEGKSMFTVTDDGTEDHSDVHWDEESYCECRECSHGGKLKEFRTSDEGRAAISASNDTRAQRAQAALQSYVEAKGEVFENSSSEIADLIADLLHLAARLPEGENTPEETVDRCLRLARMHFDAEHNNPEEHTA